VSGGGSIGQIATQGISPKTSLKALFNADTHEYIKNTSMFFWLKCRNLECGFLRTPKIEVNRTRRLDVEKISCKATFEQDFKTFAFEHNNVCLVWASSEQSMACLISPARGHF
jgi:hypothetical protein